MARLDAFLKYTGLFKTRSQARRACDEGRVSVAGEIARGSRPVRPGDRLRVETAAHRLDLEVLDVPERPVPRAQRGDYVREQGRQSLPREVLSFDDEP